MKMLVRLLLVFLLLVPAIGAHANDSSAEYATGGLRFKSDPDIAMKAEDLAISMEQVRVAYTFVNRSGADKTIMVAFPMPDITGTQAEDNPVLPTEDADNPFAFKVTADGQPVAVRLDQHAILAGIDYTERLRRLGIPLLPLSVKTNEALDRLPKPAANELKRLGVVRVETYDAGKGMSDHLEPNWTLRAAFTWMQTFPAGRETRLVQTYQPSVGGSVQTSIGSKGWRTEPDIVAGARKYCVEPDLVRAIGRAQAAKKADYPPFSERRIAYILKTGANWAGPIGDFHLTIDKGAPANLVSFCAESVVKTGPTRFEVKKVNFMPKQDLDVLILLPSQ